MRGKPTCGNRIPQSPRITPAHAGKTCLSPRVADRTADHPRACGENKHRRNLNLNQQGSPPRMRGKPLITKLTIDVIRITPAHAGKTKTESRRNQQRRDHPRACGENLPEVKMQERERGSPPRMRGKLVLWYHWFDNLRITPAHAGKTCL